MNTGLGIYALLQASGDVTALVGTRIFPALAGQEAAMPFITYEIMQVTPSDEKDGPSALDEVRVEVVCYAERYSVAADLGTKVRTALDRVAYSGEGIRIQSIRFHDVQDEVLDAPRRFLQAQDYTVRQFTDNTSTVHLGQPVTVTDGDGTQVQVAPGGTYSCIPTTAPTGIVYQRPQIGGAVRPRNDGDHFWQIENGYWPYPADPANPAEIARAAVGNSYDASFQPFALLENLNIFGNKYRWTNSAGRQGTRQTQNYSYPQFDYVTGWADAIHGYVIDHLTGLGWTAYGQNPPNGERATGTLTHEGVTYQRDLYKWQSCANYAHGLAGETQFNMGGFRDWRLPTIHELATFLAAFDGIQFGYAWTGVSAQFGEESMNHYYNVLGSTGAPPRAGAPNAPSANFWGSQSLIWDNYSINGRSINDFRPCIFVRNHF